MSGHTLRDVASTFRMMGVKSARTNTSRAVPTNWILILQNGSVLIEKTYLFTPQKHVVAFFIRTTVQSFEYFGFPNLSEIIFVSTPPEERGLHTVFPDRFGRSAELLKVRFPESRGLTYRG